MGSTILLKRQHFPLLTEGLITEGMVKASISITKSWKQACKGDQIDYDKLPTAQQMKFFPSLNSLEEKRKELIRILNDQPDGLHDQLARMVKAIPIAPEMMDTLKSTETGPFTRLAGWYELPLNAHRELGISKRELWQAMATSMQREWKAGLLYGQPASNTRILMKKASDYKTEGWKALIDKRKARKVSNNRKRNAIMEAIIYNMYRDCKYVDGEWLSGDRKVLPEQMHYNFAKEYIRIIQNTPLEVGPRLNARKKHITLTPQQAIKANLRHGNYFHPLRQGMKAVATKLQYKHRDTGHPIEIEPIDFEAFRLYITSKEFRQKALAGRHGKQKWHNEFNILGRSEMPKKAHSLWSMDDYTINRWLTINGEKTYIRAKAYIVWEAATGIPIGIHASTKPNTLEGAKAAIYDAICYSGGIAGLEVELDGAPFAQNSKEHAWLQTIFRKVSYREEANGKYAETFNNIMQIDFYKALPGYLGDNVQSKKEDSKRKDSIGALKDYPEISLLDEIHRLQEYRAQKAAERYEYGKLKAKKQWQPGAIQPRGITRGQKLIDKHPEAQALPAKLLIDAFGSREKVAEIRNNTVQMIYQGGRPFEFEADMVQLMASPEKARLLGQHWEVKLAYLQTSFTGLKPWHGEAVNGLMADQVNIYAFTDRKNSDNDQYIATLPALVRGQKAKFERTPEEQQAHNRRMAKRKQLKDAVKQHEKQQQDILEILYADLDEGDAEVVAANPYLAAKHTGAEPKKLEWGASEWVDKVKEKMDEQPDAPNQPDNQNPGSQQAGGIDPLSIWD